MIFRACNVARAVHGSLAPGPGRSVRAGPAAQYRRGEARMAAREARTGAARDSVRYWAGAVGAAAMVAGIVSVVVMVQMQKPKTKAAAPPQRTVAASETRP